jgi:hypothetical protein
MKTTEENARNCANRLHPQRKTTFPAMMNSHLALMKKVGPALPPENRNS